MGIIHHANVLRHCQSPELAALDAITAADALLGVNDGVEVGVGDGGGDAELGHAAQYPTAAGAAVADVVDTVPVVARAVHQSRLLGLVQDAQCLLFGDCPVYLALVESTLNRCENQAVLDRVVASLADEPLLDAADAVAHTPRLGPSQ